MYEIIVVSHGSFAKGLVESAELIAGSNSEVITFGLFEGANIDDFKNSIKEAITAAKSRKDVIVLTDLMSGTPFNVVSMLMSEIDFHHITGINLPIYLELYTSRTSCEASEICGNLKEFGLQSFIYVNDLI